jgi:hypothetical protein
MTAEVEVLVLRERVRGLEALVETLRGALDTNSQLGLATAQATRGLGFGVLGRAAMATAEADEPIGDLVQEPKKSEIEIHWLSKPQPADAITSEA